MAGLKTMRRALRTVGLALWLSAAGCVAGLHAAPPAGGLVWQMRAEAGTVYIAGSMHLLHRDRPQLPPAIEAAYREAESLVMEIDVDDADEQAMAALMLRTARFADGRSLPQVAGEARWQRLRGLLARSGVPEAFGATLEPWGAAIMLTTLEYARLGFDPAVGVERQLQQRAAADSKPISGLETPQFQLGLLDALPLGGQLQLLDLTLDELAQMPRLVDTLYGAWRAGDLAVLEALLLEGYADMPQLYDALVDRRNRNWIPQLQSLLQQQEDSLVVVGALHLVGERGLLALLARAGITVTPYRPTEPAVPGAATGIATDPVTGAAAVALVAP
jgi:uncharacterized protein YbaP (TraB family)